MIQVDIVVVTYNRLEKLKKTLSCYSAQSAPFRTLIVVDNNSSDGTRDFLKEWESTAECFKKHVIHLDSNLGGSGGFYAGESYALSLNGDWVFIADDDAYPDIDLIREFNNFSQCNTVSKYSAICAEVLYGDGTININHRHRYVITAEKRYQSIPVPVEEYRHQSFEINQLSYVGSFLNTRALLQVGLVDPSFFIYQDDIEHSIRLGQYGIMCCVPRMKIVHDELTRNVDGADNLNVIWKEYYAARNRTIMLFQISKATGLVNIIDSLRLIGAHKESSLHPVQKACLEGYWDGIRNKKGIHSFYRPGKIVDINEKFPYPKYIWKFLFVLLRLF